MKFFQIHERKETWQRAVGPLDNEGIKGKDKDDMEIAGKQNELFASWGTGGLFN